MVPTGKGHLRKGYGKLNAVNSTGKKKKLRVSVDNQKSADSNVAGNYSCQSDHVLFLPLVKSVERERMLPRFSSVLGRSPDEGVHMEDLDSLQLELEALLTAVVVRRKALREEVETVNSAEERTRRKNIVSQTAHTSGKRGSVQCRGKNKLKYGKLKGVEKKPAPIKLTEVKSIPTKTSSINIRLPEPEPQKSERAVAPKRVQPRYDIPNRFWFSVDAYCTELNDNDVRFLKDLCKEFDKDVEELKKIPPLGQHYSLRWAQEDVQYESKESAVTEKRSSTPDCDVLFQKVRLPKEKPPEESATKCIVSAMMQEVADIQDSDEVFDAKMFRNHLPSSSTSFERRVKKQLKEEDIVEVISDSESDDEDEILNEIKKCQTELSRINCLNRRRIKSMINAVEDQMKRQVLKKQLQDIDNEIVKRYRHVVATKRQKKPLTENEQKEMWEILRKRSALVIELDAKK